MREIYWNLLLKTGIPLDLLACFAFLDGTFREIARPGHGHQEAAYNGKECRHGLKYLQLALPDGIIAFCYGPIEGWHHDSFVLGESDLLQQLQRILERLRRRAGRLLNFCVFADTAFPFAEGIVTSHRNPTTPSEEAFNASHKVVRVAVEWSFQKVTKLFPFISARPGDFSCIFLSPLARYHRVATLLTNAHTCCYGNQTSSYFNINPITLEAYFNN